MHFGIKNITQVEYSWDYQISLVDSLIYISPMLRTHEMQIYSSPHDNE